MPSVGTFGTRGVVFNRGEMLIAAARTSLIFMVWPRLLVSEAMVHARCRATTGSRGQIALGMLTVTSAPAQVTVSDHPGSNPGVLIAHACNITGIAKGLAAD